MSKMKWGKIIMCQIKDSGERTEYSTGAVRDCKSGKGRFDLMPMDILYILSGNNFYKSISNFKETGMIGYLQEAFDNASKDFEYENGFYSFLEVAKHFENGAHKYGENNWQKGIPVSSYIDSACRHYTKHMAGERDEPHDRACLWNLICCVWTIERFPELDNYTKGSKVDQ